LQIDINRPPVVARDVGRHGRERFNCGWPRRRGSTVPETGEPGRAPRSQLRCWSSPVIVTRSGLAVRNVVCPRSPFNRAECRTGSDNDRARASAFVITGLPRLVRHTESPRTCGRGEEDRRQKITVLGLPTKRTGILSSRHRDNRPAAPVIKKLLRCALPSW